MTDGGSGWSSWTVNVIFGDSEGRHVLGGIFVGGDGSLPSKYIQYSIFMYIQHDAT